MQKDIIEPVDRQLIEAELTSELFLKNTNNGGNQIYIVSEANAPNTLREIGRLREISFRGAGGGTGMRLDLDDFDIGEKSFRQLIVWNPADKEIIGGYRFIRGSDMRSNITGRPVSPTAEIFHFSESFITKYLPVTIELGRSWVQPQYQPSYDFRKGIYSLDNLWDGLGGLVARYSDVEYFFGKITMYPSFNREARDLILGFMTHYFQDKDGLVMPLKEYEIVAGDAFLKMKQNFNCNDYDKDYKELMKLVKKLGEHVPPLFNAYMNLSPSMKVFGTARNPYFGDVEETGIFIKIADIYPAKKERHVKG